MFKCICSISAVVSFLLLLKDIVTQAVYRPRQCIKEAFGALITVSEIESVTTMVRSIEKHREAVQWSQSSGPTSNKQVGSKEEQTRSGKSF